MKLNELILTENLSPKQNEFLTVHNNILSAGSLISTNLINLAKNLKIMRDQKLYTEIDCQSFEDYAEKVCGLKQRQAYTYIQVIENLDDKFLQSTAKIGVTKLSLLASLTESEQKEIVETVAVEDVSVKELKEEVKKLKNKNDNLIESKAKIEEVNQILKDQISMFEKDKEKAIRQEQQKLKQTIKELKDEIEELQNRPVETVAIENPETQKKIEQLEQTIKLHEQTIATKESQLKISNSIELTKFKIKFEELQQRICEIVELVKTLPEEKQEGCKNALKKVGEMLC